MTDREELVERMDAESMKNSMIAPDQCGSINDAHLPEGERMPEANQVDFDVLVNGYGAAAPGLILRDENGAPIVGVLLDHHWGLDLSRRMFAAAASGMERLARAGVVDSPKRVQAMLEEQVESLLEECAPTVLGSLKARAAIQGRELMQADAYAMALAAEREATERANRRHKERILALAKGAAAVDRDVRAAALRDAKEWLTEVANS